MFKYFNNINIITMENKCYLCGYEWDSRKEDPKQCPRCKRYDYKKKKEV